jgi:hypothetical protein
MADRLVAPRLDSAEVERVREQIASAVDQRTENPDALLEHLADSSAFSDHPYGLSTVGSEASLRGITLAQLRAYQRAQLVKSRLFVVIVGNVSRERVERLMRRTFSTLPAGNYTWTLPDVPPERPSGATFVNRRLPTNYLQGYYVGPPATSPDYAALRLASAVLSGRLFTEIREKRNLTYAVDAPFRERAIAIGGLYVTTTQPDVVLDISLQVARLLQAKGVQVLLTRTSEIDVDLPPRVSLANSSGANAFVSIHANALSMARPDVNGIETFYFQSSLSRALAAAIQSEVLAVSPGSPDRGVRTGRFFVIRRTVMPAALVETGFVTGDIDSPRLATASHRQRLAQAISSGILRYLAGG